jgi:hypothetical protein
MRPFASVDLVSRPIVVPFCLRHFIQAYRKEGLWSSGNLPPTALEIEDVADSGQDPTLRNSTHHAKQVFYVKVLKIL